MTKNSSSNIKAVLFVISLWSVIFATILAGVHPALILKAQFSDTDAFEVFTYKYIIEYVSSPVGLTLISINIVFALMPMIALSRTALKLTDKL